MLARLKGFLHSSVKKRAHIDDLKGGSVDDPSPLRILPNELLSHIFVLCTGDSPLRMFYYQLEVPHQRTISQVCSRWRQVALNTPVLWSNVHIMADFNTEYARHLHLYRTWVCRAGDYPLTVSLLFYALYPDIYKVFLDFVVPFRIQKLDITMPYHKLMCLPPLDVDEFAIVVTEIRADEDLKVPPFMDKTRHICISYSAAALEECEPKLRKLCLSWHQLRSFECYSPKISLSTWLNVLRQPGTLQYLERFHLTIAGTGSGPLVGVCMPNVHWFSLTLLHMQPDIVIPLIAVPNITTLKISYDDDRSSETDLYDIIKRQYKLHQLHEIRLQGARFFLPIPQILADAPMIHTLYVVRTPILDAEAREGISSGRLGRYLTTLHISSCFNNAEEWLDVIEARQRNLKSIVAHVSNWREMFMGIKSVELWNVPYGGRDYKKRVAALEALGTTVKLV